MPAPHQIPYTLIADSPRIEGTPYRPLYGGPYRLSMGEVLHGAALAYPDLGLVFDDVSYPIPLYGERDDGPTTTSMTLYEFLLTADYPQWVEKDIVLMLGMPIPMDLLGGPDSGTWFLKVGHMLADGEYLYLELLGGGSGCNVVQAEGTGNHCSTLHPIPISAICSICMPEGERWGRCPPTAPLVPPPPPPEMECINNWGLVHE